MAFLLQLFLPGCYSFLISVKAAIAFARRRHPIDRFVSLMNRRSILSVLFLLLSFGAEAKTIRYALVQQGKTWKVIDSSGKPIIDSLFAGYDFFAFNSCTEGMLAYPLGNKVGYKNLRNEVIVPPVFGSAAGFKHGCAIVNTGTAMGIMHRSGKLFADTIYGHISEQSKEGLYVLRKGNELSVMDTTGHFIFKGGWFVDTKLMPNSAYEEGLLAVMVNTNSVQNNAFFFNGHNEDHLRWKIGFVDTKGKLVIDTIFNFYGTMANSDDDARRAMAGGQICGTGMKSLMDHLHEPHDPWYLNGDYYRFEGGRCAVAKDGQLFVINLKGDSVFSLPAFHRISNTGGYFIVREYGRFDLTGRSEPVYGLLGRNGTTLLEAKYGAIGPLSEGFFCVQMSSDYNGDHRYADTNGKFHFGYYKIADDFSLGYARVKGNKKDDNESDYGHIDRKGKFYQINTLWPVAGDYGGLLLASKYDKRSGRGLWGCVDEKHHWVIAPLYADLGFMRFGRMAFRNSDLTKWGYLDSSGKELIPAIYDQAFEFKEGTW